MYKLIAIDMDGTLLNNRGEITPQNKAAIEEVRAQGVQVVLASGRPVEAMQFALNELKLISDNDYVMSYNAAVIQKVQSKTIIWQQTLTGADVKELAKLASVLNIDCHAYSLEYGLTTTKKNRYAGHEKKMNNVALTVKKFTTFADDTTVFKVMFMACKDKLNQMITSIPPYYYQQYSVIRTTNFCLEFTHKNNTKGLGVKALAEHLSILPEQVMCIGDQENDHSMLLYAGLGVAMGNATPKTKSLSNYTTLINNKSGVAHAINQFILK